MYVGDDGEIGRKDRHWIYIYIYREIGEKRKELFYYNYFSSRSLMVFYGTRRLFYIFLSFSHPIFSFVTHARTIMIIFFLYKWMNKKENNNKAFSLVPVFFFFWTWCYIQDNISMFYYCWWIECFWRQKGGCVFSSSFFFFASALY